MIDRFYGYVERVHAESLWIRPDHGGTGLYAHKKEVPSIKSHWCVYHDQVVSYVLGNYQGRQQAMDVRPESFSENEVELAETEISRIAVWFGMHGFAARQEPNCGCRIFVHSAVAKRQLYTGDLIKHGVHKDQKGDWEAFNIHVIESKAAPKQHQFVEEFHSLEPAWRHKSGRNHHVGGLR